MAFSEGQLLHDGQYTIERVLNSGRFGVSYLARAKRGQRVVIKTFRDEIWEQWGGDKDKWNNQILQEAGLLARFDHPHIVEFFQPFIEDGQVCLVMEYVAGTDLATLAEQHLPLDEALDYVQQVGEALKVVHTEGLVHRDVKPANIMLRAGEPEVVLIDFGLAGGSETTLTVNTATRQAGFAAPELYDATVKAGSYTDVYGLGATLYALLAGVAPPAADQRRDDSLPPLAGVEKRVQRAIRQAMRLDWEARLQTVEEFLDLLGVDADELPPLPSPTSEGKHTRLQTYVAIVTLVVTIVGIGVGVFGDELKGWLRRPEPTPTPQETQD
ncbi:MAG: serine/threonine protein kinase [Spirulina sp. SIO3F2]|nr:serine/threonine protein kinase [Spirulina sp. SIO3F2]